MSVVSVERFDQAAELLASASAMRSQNAHADGASSMVGLEWLARPFGVGELLGRIGAYLAGLLLSQLEPIDRALQQLAGDAGALRVHAEQLAGLDDRFTAHAHASRQVADQVRAHWSGSAADAYFATAAAEAGCAEAAGGPGATMATRVLEVGDYVGQARRAIIMATGLVVRQIVKDLAMQMLIPGAILKGAALVAQVHRFLSGLFADIADMLQDVVARGTEMLGQVSGLGRAYLRAAEVLRSGKDPGELGAVASGSNAANIQGEQQAHDRTLMELTDKHGEGTTLPPYERVTDPDQLKALGTDDPAMLDDPESGFHAAVYVNPETGEKVVVFSGTDFGDLDGDVAEDAEGTTVLSTQSLRAMQLAQAINNGPHADDFVYSGHSLGGRLAAVASMTSGNGAVTYNAAGVSPATIDYLARMNGEDPAVLRARLEAGQVRLYTTADDPLTNVQENWDISARTAPDAVGRQYHLGGDHNPVTEAAKGHDMDNVIAEYDEAFPN